MHARIVSREQQQVFTQRVSQQQIFRQRVSRARACMHSSCPQGNNNIHATCLESNGKYSRNVSREPRHACTHCVLRATTSIYATCPERNSKYPRNVSREQQQVFTQRVSRATASIHATCLESNARHARNSVLSCQFSHMRNKWSDAHEIDNIHVCLAVHTLYVDNLLYSV